MLKGHVMIELHNHHSGSRERIEGDNLVTHAIGRAIPTLFSGGRTAGYIMPLYNRMLGGLLLFDGEIEEDPENFFLPSNSHLVAMADQTVDLQYKDRGSFNVAESMSTDSGYVTVWDFSTSQANGIIGALARTWVENDGKMNRFFTGRSNSIGTLHNTISLAGNESNEIAPLIYDEESQMLYYIGITDGYSVTTQSEGGNTIWTYTYTIYKEYIPTNKFKVRDTVNMKRKPEHVTTFSFESCDNIDDVTFFRNGYDGYAYFVKAKENSEGDGQFSYFTLKLSDMSFEKSEIRTVTAAGCHLRKSCGYAIKGKAYLLAKDLKGVYIVNLSNPADITFAQMPEDMTFLNESYYSSITTNRNGGLIGDLYKGYNAYNSIIYPDGSFFVKDQKNEDTNTRVKKVGLIEKNMMIWGSERANNIYYSGNGWFYNSYLGTIYNLSSPVEKTPSTSMKVVYTLTEVDE